MRIVDDVGIQPIDLGPQKRVAEIQLREVPQRVAAFDGVRRRCRFLRTDTSRAEQRKDERSQYGNACPANLEMSLLAANCSAEHRSTPVRS